MFVKTISVMSLCAALSLIGCADHRLAGSGSDPGSGTGPARLGKGCHPLRQKCIVEITADGSQACGFAFDPDEARLKRSWRDFVIAWRLPPGYEFREDLGDGVTFPKEPPGDQFKDNWATDDDDGGPPSGALVTKHRYRWVFKNTVNEDRIYHYRVQFHKKNTNEPTIVCDPAISNLGGI